MSQDEAKQSAIPADIASAAVISLQSGEVVQTGVLVSQSSCQSDLNNHAASVASMTLTSAAVAPLGAIIAPGDLLAHARSLTTDQVLDHINIGWSGICVKLVDLAPYIEVCFERIENGEEVAGYTSKKDFCKNVLNKTYGAVKFMLSGGNPRNKRNNGRNQLPLVPPVGGTVAQTDVETTTASESLAETVEEPSIGTVIPAAEISGTEFKADEQVVEPQPGTFENPYSNGRYIWYGYEQETEEYKRDDDGQLVEDENGDTVIILVTKTCWGAWKVGENHNTHYARGGRCDNEEEVSQIAHDLAEQDEERENREKQIAAEDAEDDLIAAELAAKGIPLPRHDPKVLRLCRKVLKKRPSGRSIEDLAKQILKPEVPRDTTEEDALFAKYEHKHDDWEYEESDADDEPKRRKPTYKFSVTVNGSKLGSVIKKVKSVFGKDVVRVEKVSRTSSRADELASAMNGVKDAIEVCHSLKEALEQWKENLPQQFQDGQKGEELDEVVNQLESVIEGLESADSEADNVEFPGMY